MTTIKRFNFVAKPGTIEERIAAIEAALEDMAAGYHSQRSDNAVEAGHHAKGANDASNPNTVFKFN